MQEGAEDIAPFAQRVDSRGVLEPCVDALDGQRQVDLRLAGKDVGHAVLAQLGEMAVRDLLAEHRNGVIATDIVLAEMDAAGRIDADSEFAAVAVAAEAAKNARLFMFPPSE